MDTKQTRHGGTGSRTRVAAGPTRPAQQVENNLEGLQHQAGNRAVTELLSRGQARLEVGAVHDPFEAEADHVSHQVVQLLGARGNLEGLQRQAGNRAVVELLHRGGSGPPASRTSGGRAPVASRIMRRTSAPGSGKGLGYKAEGAISAARGGGSALAPEVRTSMESAFGGVDFSGVRVHSGPGAESLNRKVSAKAFTVGSDIFFSGGVPDKSPEGQELLAHELTHTIQQGGSRSADGGGGSVVQPTLQRWPWSKKKAAENPDQVKANMLLSREISNVIAKHPTMKEAEELRSAGKEDEALDLLQKFWDSSITINDPATGKPRRVRLTEFKPLMFTPSERRMLRIKKWRLASTLKAWWDESVRKGEVHDPHPEKEEADSSKSVDTVTGIVDSVGGVNTAGYLGSKIGEEVQNEQQEEAGELITKDLDKAMGISAPKLTTGQEIKQDVGKEWKSLTDEKYISDKNDSNYEAEKFSNKSAWANGIISVVGDAISLVSSVTSLISLILDKKATKADVASQLNTSLSQASTTAQGILETIEEAKGSELTTHMFHWVPGLSIFSNGFAAIGSAVSLVQKAIRLHKVRMSQAKVIQKERDDLKLALERIWVRSSQQVEQDAFNTAKSLTNVGLSIAEVASGGGFGIPRLAQIVVSGAGALHRFGHVVADSVRAAASKKARTGYFAAHLTGSAETLIRTDPLAASETIISRAAEGDPTCVELLQSYGVEIPGLTAPTEKNAKFTTTSGVSMNERMFSYSPKDTLLYDAGLAKLMQGLKEDDQPKTIGDKIKNALGSALKTPGALRDRFRQAKRIGQVRNEQNYGGVSDRGTWWNIKQTVFGGEAGVKKLSETTAKRINEAFAVGSSGMYGPNQSKKSFGNINDKTTRDLLLNEIRPEEVLRAKREDARAEQERPKIDISGPLTQGQIAEVSEARVKAQNMSIGALSLMIHAGRPETMLTDVWRVYVAVFVERFKEKAAVPVGATH